jgi:hypothetical protein
MSNGVSSAAFAQPQLLVEEAQTFLFPTARGAAAITILPKFAGATIR